MHPAAKHNPTAPPRFKKGDFVNLEARGNIVLAVITKVDRSVLGTTYCWRSESAGLKGTGRPESKITAAADPALAGDPDMVGWTMGKEKRGPVMREGYFFEAPLLRDGVKVGRVVDYGNGGVMRVECRDPKQEHAFTSACAAWMTKHRPGDRADAVDMFYSWWMDGRTAGVTAKPFLDAHDARIQAMLGRAPAEVATPTA